QSYNNKVLKKCTIPSETQYILQKIKLMAVMFVTPSLSDRRKYTCSRESVAKRTYVATSERSVSRSTK
ncbi:hypothetical protein L9F63_024627, partial [Diploptera punctata]